MRRFASGVMEITFRILPQTCVRHYFYMYYRLLENGISRARARARPPFIYGFSRVPRSCLQYLIGNCVYNKIEFLFSVYQEVVLGDCELAEFVITAEDPSSRNASQACWVQEYGNTFEGWIRDTGIPFLVFCEVPCCMITFNMVYGCAADWYLLGEAGAVNP